MGISLANGVFGLGGDNAPLPEDSLSLAFSENLMGRRTTILRPIIVN